MNKKRADVRFVKRGETLNAEGSVGVSLHCHTLHSKETLEFVPYYAERIPVLAQSWRCVKRRRLEMYGAEPDFKKGYWEPPLTGPDVISSEIRSIASLGLDGFVSITDHDSIDANVAAREQGRPGLPISMEWTVPFQNAFFHVGVHNLPLAEVRDIVRDLLDYTKAPGVPDETRLTELLTMLGERPEVLVVLNHPIWDIEMIGQEAHDRALNEFLRRFASLVHAIEINGFRSWSENEAAMEIAEAVGLPVVSGGDRHCCQHNTMINVTDASNFAEFVDEVRVGRYSRVAVLPEYNIPLPSRQLASISQILSEMKELGYARRSWTDRVHIDTGDGRGLITLTEQWNGSRPVWTYAAIGLLRVLAHPVMRPIIKMAVGDTDIGRDDAPATPTKTIKPGIIIPTRLDVEVG